jgi:hypothetical protein
MSKLKLTQILLILSLSALTISCKDEVSGSSDKLGLTDNLVEEEAPLNEEPEVAPEFTQIFMQDFESFDLRGSWMLDDFGLQGESDKEKYAVDGKLGFDIQWTKKTRNLLADKLGFERSQMTRDFTNSHCEPKIEIGKQSVYSSSESENIIAELDSDVSHCGVSGNEPAALSIRSFIPTKTGYMYKVKVSYMMRSRNPELDKSHKDLVVRFGGEVEKFDPVYESMQTVELEMVALRKFSKLTLADNGLPDSFGVLIDDILIEQGGKAPLYDECAAMFKTNSRGFRKCLQGEVETNRACDLSQAIIKTSKGDGIASNRRNIENIFNDSPAQNGNINFFSLGLKGKVIVSCAIDGHAAHYAIEDKTISLREISWGNVTPTSYPELAKVRVKLSGCVDESLNRTINLGNVATSEEFSYTFDQDDEGRSFTGCKMDKLIIKDITPNGPSADGFDLNSLQFVD